MGAAQTVNAPVGETSLTEGDPAIPAGPEGWRVPVFPAPLRAGQGRSQAPDAFRQSQETFSSDTSPASMSRPSGACSEKARRRSSLSQSAWLTGGSGSGRAPGRP